MTSLLERSALKGVKIIFFDFDGVFTDNKVYVDSYGVESVRCSRFDGLGISRLRASGVSCVIISSEVNEVVARRAEKLGVECFNGVKNKLDVAKQVCERENLCLNDAAFVGNDVNDLEVLRSIGFPIIVKDAHPDLQGYDFLITTLCGGEGAVREVCDTIFYSQSGECDK